VAEYIHNHRLPCEVMIMTAYPQFDFVMKAVECRIAAFLIKPIQREKLQQEMLNLLKENQYEQQKQLSLRQHSHLYFKMLDTSL
jgi:YesN/AraC family two-component response regulator